MSTIRIRIRRKEIETYVAEVDLPREQAQRLLLTAPEANDDILKELCPPLAETWMGSGIPHFDVERVEVP